MKDKSGNRPLLSFAICAYQQERFIREAVEAALAQTYSPLEIILSDDCSTDRTFEIMRELAGNYHGPHQLVLNRNAANLGIARHVNRIMELVHGELFIGAAGDDISLPNRVEEVFKAWECSGRRATGIQSNFIAIDEAGSVLNELTDSTVTDPTEFPRQKSISESYVGTWVAGIQSNFVAINETGSVLGELANSTVTDPTEFPRQKPMLESFVNASETGIIGCAFTCNPSVFSVFGPLPDPLIHEDQVIALRALCLGSLVFISIPLVKRRFHRNNLYSRCHKLATTWDAVAQQENRMIRDAKDRQVIYDVFLSDLQTARVKKLIGNEQWGRLTNVCLHRRRLFGYQVKYTRATLVRKLQILFSAWRVPGCGKPIKWMLLRLIPKTLFRSLKVISNSARLYLAIHLATLARASTQKRN